MSAILSAAAANAAWLDEHPLAWTIPTPGGWMTSNQRPHWAARARDVRAWRHAITALARRDGIPTGLQHVHITISIHQSAGRGRTRDVGNLQPTAKAVIDGLVDHGLIPDDNDQHLTGPDLRRGADGPAALTITITKGQQP